MVSSSWNEDTNDSVRITFNEGLNIKGWRITTSDELPEFFEEIESEEIESEYIEDEDTDYLEEQGYNTSFTVTKSLKTGVTYYAWIKDATNNVMYQTFTISKVEI